LTVSKVLRASVTDAPRALNFQRRNTAAAYPPRRKRLPCVCGEPIEMIKNCLLEA
jgi:hypothetical protein